MGHLVMRTLSACNGAHSLILGTVVVNAAILYNQRRLEAGLKRTKITSFREELCRCLMQMNQKAEDDQEFQSFNHKLHETTEREAGKRSD